MNSALFTLVYVILYLPFHFEIVNAWSFSNRGPPLLVVHACLILFSLATLQRPGAGLFLILFRLLGQVFYCFDHSFWRVNYLDRFYWFDRQNRVIGPEVFWPVVGIRLPRARFVCGVLSSPDGFPRHKQIAVLFNWGDVYVRKIRVEQSSCCGLHLIKFNTQHNPRISTKLNKPGLSKIKNNYSISSTQNNRSISNI
jgi:hypothetical protein